MREWIIRILLKLLFLGYPKLYRTTVHNRPQDAYSKPHLYAHYHGDELVLVPSQRNKKITTLSSMSKDGKRMSSLLKFLGYQVIVGSSSRRSVGGLIELKNHILDKPGPVSFAVDGPRGPRHEIKPGVIWLSQKLSMPIIFLSVKCNRKWVFKKSWNQTYIPKPFSHVQIYCSNPYMPPTDQDSKVLARENTMILKAFNLNPERSSVAFWHS
jgi:lysophospholipid acyltransferase (LPLAT)-like uncharacterized protein